MRITYYEFPEAMSIREIALVHKQVIEGRKDIRSVPADIPDEVLARNFSDRVDCSVTMAKKLMKAYGGRAYTQHFDRDGSLFECTPVLLKGNNSTHKYNRHL